ncbi:MAG TPA: benzoate-CoA ligase family protein [Chloroflexota bacterium]|nr:benzoate-CoA ligase family protein [Chloroflexota bacterium]
MIDVEISVPAEMNVCDLLLDANVRQGRGDKVAVIAGEREVTYSGLVEMTARLASGLAELGVRPEERVLILLPDSVEFVVAYLGVMRLGAIAVPLNTLLKPRDYEYLLTDSRASAVIVDLDYLAQLPLSALPCLRHVIVVASESEPTLSLAQKRVGVSEPRSQGAPGVNAYRDLLAAGSPTYPPFLLSSDDAGFWLYSSGTTGFPKATVHLHQDVLFCMQYGQGVLEVDDSVRTFASSKLFFAYALGCSLHIPLLAGGTTILHAGRATPAEIAEIARKHKPTLFFSVPTFYAASMHAGVAKEAYESVRFCVSAGEALPAPIYEAWLDKTGKEIIEHIGSTEHIYAFISNRPGAVRPGSSGKPVPGIEARIVDETFQDVPRGQAGELLIKSGSTCIAYWNKRRQTKATFLGEWLRTGDVFAQDEDSYFWYRGRGNDMLKVSGIWVSPIEVEQTLLEHVCVQEAAVIGVPDHDGLIKPKAFVVKSSEVNEDDLKLFVKDRLAPYKYPRWIEFVDELPRTATGKLQRYQLRR